jgi:hypothetical protein
MRGVVFVLEQLNVLTGTDLSSNMAAAVAEAESFDRALKNAVVSITSISDTVSKLSEALPDRTAAGQNPDIVQFNEETAQARASSFLFYRGRAAVRVSASASAMSASSTMRSTPPSAASWPPLVRVRSQLSKRSGIPANRCAAREWRSPGPAPGPSGGGSQDRWS